MLDSTLTAVPLARRGERRQLPRHARRRADDLDADRLRRDALVLGKFAFPRIQEALDKRQQAIEEAIEASERARAEADEAARGVPRAAARGARAGRGDRRCARARRPRSTSASRSRPRASSARSCSSRPAATSRPRPRRAIQEIRNEVADLTVLATEKVTRKSLADDDQQRLVAGGARGARLLGARRQNGRRGSGGGDRTGLLALAVRGRQGARQARPDQGAAGRVRRRARQNRELAVFFFSPYFSTEEKEAGLRRARRGRGPDAVNFLELLIENHRMPVIFRIAAAVRGALGPREPAAAGRGHQRGRARPADRRGARPHGSASRPARTSSSTSTVDPDILGGIVLRVGNSILDASIQNRLEQLRQRSAPRPT